ncbi:hypothetical protein ACQR1V_05120 [Bradyrhizobium oligotrophicum]|uniref:hypothetical protein n=1 Tax=Bradyrhizobium oligotrophicum TaxID=44255 RepID=UPI003EBA024F
MTNTETIAITLNQSVSSRRRRFCIAPFSASPDVPDGHHCTSRVGHLRDLNMQVFG